jgi:hypothetical protein
MPSACLDLIGSIAARAAYNETGKLGPDDLKRWKKAEKPVTIIG